MDWAQNARRCRHRQAPGGWFSGLVRYCVTRLSAQDTSSRGSWGAGKRAYRSVKQLFVCAIPIERQYRERQRTSVAEDLILHGFKNGPHNAESFSDSGMVACFFNRAAVISPTIVSTGDRCLT